MDDRDVLESEAAWLARMMDLGREDQALWKPEELGAIFEHQLSAPLELDFSYLGPEEAGRLQGLCRAANPPIRSFRDLLDHPRPPVDLLKTAKDFARASQAASLLPAEVATMLYILSIVAAMTRCRQRITKLDGQGLRHILDWALEQSWVDDPTRDRLREGHRASQHLESESDV